ncbi:hypothetical protein B0H10DRAFT_1958582 [Mycena sp. CBHHK59/15]|nr:hypothetical protein B0H10DRAFT_1958582 [Mycena sp. CBHHK59/15]
MYRLSQEERLQITADRRPRTTPETQTFGRGDAYKCGETRCQKNGEATGGTLQREECRRRTPRTRTSMQTSLVQEFPGNKQTVPSSPMTKIWEKNLQQWIYVPRIQRALSYLGFECRCTRSNIRGRGVPGTHASPTSDEWVATQALATLAALAELGLTFQGPRLRIQYWNAPIAIRLIGWTIPPAAAIYPALAAQTYAACHAPTGVTMAAAGNGPDVRSPPISEGVGPLSRVQAAQARVAALNSGNLTRPTSADAAQWGRRKMVYVCLEGKVGTGVDAVYMGQWVGDLYSVTRVGQLAQTANQ